MTDTDKLMALLSATEQHAERGWNEAHEQEARAEAAEKRVLELQAERDQMSAGNLNMKSLIADGCKWDGEQWVGLSAETPATDAWQREQMSVSLFPETEINRIRACVGRMESALAKTFGVKRA